MAGELERRGDPVEERRKGIRNEIARRLLEKGQPRPCVLCGTSNWIIGSYAAIGASNTPSQMQADPYGSVYPMVTVFCNNCGNTHFINLLTLGFTAEDWAWLTLPD